MKTILKWLLVPIALVLGLSLAFSFFGKTMKNALGFLNFDFQENWRETVSTDNGIKGTTNGGLTVPEIEKFKELALEMPFYSDVFKQSIVVESNNYVAIYRQVEGTSNFYNLNFVKTDKGLVYDGAVGVSVEMPVNWLTGHRSFDKAKVNLSTELSAYSSERADNVVLGFLKLIFNGNGELNEENTITFSDFKTTFAKGFNNVNAGAGLFTNNKAAQDLFLFITEYLAKNVMKPYFQTLTDFKQDINIELKTGIENINNPEYVKRQLNTFATYLWKNSRTDNKETKDSLVNVSEYYTSFIPERLQLNYPILNEEDKTTFAGFNYYPMYDNNVFFNTHYFYSNVEPKRNEHTIKNDKDVKKDKGNIQEIEIQETEFAKLSLVLQNKNNADLTLANLKSNPVLIGLNDRTIVVDSVLKFNQEIALPINTKVNWTINSNNLLFDSYSGSFNLTDLLATKIFNFQYYDNKIPTFIKLHPISGLDISNIDLSLNPVVIALVNAETSEIKTFRFNNNSFLETGLTQLLLPGDYTYTIVSSDLQFSQHSGSVIFSSEHRHHIFTFWTETEDGNIVVSGPSPVGIHISGPGKDLYLPYMSAGTKFFRFVFSSTLKVYPDNIEINIFDKNTENLIFSISDVKNDSIYKTSSVFLIELPQYFLMDTEVIIQFKITEGSIVVSNILEAVITSPTLSNNYFTFTSFALFGFV